MLVKPRAYVQLRKRYRIPKTEAQLKDNWRIAKCDEIFEETDNGDVKLKRAGKSTRR